jgi:hypothetical protein
MDYLLLQVGMLEDWGRAERESPSEWRAECLAPHDACCDMAFEWALAAVHMLELIIDELPAAFVRDVLEIGARVSTSTRAASSPLEAAGPQSGRRGCSTGCRCLSDHVPGSLCSFIEPLASPLSPAARATAPAPVTAGPGASSPGDSGAAAPSAPAPLGSAPGYSTSRERGARE